jgi:hypothetical protein
MKLVIDICRIVKSYRNNEISTQAIAGMVCYFTLTAHDKLLFRHININMHAESQINCSTLAC